MDRVTAIATDAMELAGLLLITAAFGLGASHLWGTPAGLLTSGVVLLLVSGLLTAIKTPTDDKEGADE